MLKHIAEPKKAMIVSKVGTKAAITTMTIIIVVRIKPLSNPRVYGDEPRKLDDGGIVRTCRPARISMVTKIGRALDKWVSELVQ